MFVSLCLYVHILFSWVCMAQITSLECTREQNFEISPSNGIACALKVLCSGKAEFYEQHRWVVEIAEPKDQCPIQDKSIHRKVDLSSLVDQPFSFPGQSASSSISPINKILKKVNLCQVSYIPFFFSFQLKFIFASLKT